MLFSGTFILLSTGLASALPSMFEKRLMSTDNTCGVKNGLTCNPTASGGGPCCSTNGYCGSGTAYCGSGCQWEFSANFTGGCGASKPSLNTCGKNGGTVCNPTPLANGRGADNNTIWVGGACCSSGGYCGTSQDYCLSNNGCNPLFGKCYNTTGSSSPDPVRVVATPSTVPGNTGFSIGNVGVFARKWSWTFNQQNYKAGQMPPGWIVNTNDAITSGDKNQYIWGTRPSNVQIKNNYLQLTVPGGQTSGKQINGGEVQTCIQNIKYGSFRTKAIVSNVAGTCSGTFFIAPYVSDTAPRHEIDIEYLSDINSNSQPFTVNAQGQNVPFKGVHFTQYTNQNDPDNGSTYTPMPAPLALNLETTVHEYRMDWLPGKVMYYLDGTLQRVLTTNVPTMPGGWVINHWTSGDPGWSYGPPKTNATYQIQSFTMYYNVSGADAAATTQCPQGWST